MFTFSSFSLIFFEVEPSRCRHQVSPAYNTAATSPAMTPTGQKIVKTPAAPPPGNAAHTEPRFTFIAKMRPVNF